MSDNTSNIIQFPAKKISSQQAFDNPLFTYLQRTVEDSRYFADGPTGYRDYIRLLGCVTTPEEMPPLSTLIVDSTFRKDIVPIFPAQADTSFIQIHEVYRKDGSLLPINPDKVMREISEYLDFFPVEQRYMKEVILAFVDTLVTMPNIQQVLGVVPLDIPDTVSFECSLGEYRNGLLVTYTFAISVIPMLLDDCAYRYLQQLEKQLKPTEGV